MSNWYVDAAAAGSANGTSWANAWTSLASISQAALSGDALGWRKSGPADAPFAVSKSGTSGHRITYIGTGATRPVVRGINGGTFTDIAVVNLEITQVSTANNYDAISLSSGSARWLVQDCYIHYTYLSGINGTTTGTIVRHCTFDDVGGISGGWGGGSNPNNISLIGDSNLIEYNTVTKGMDRCRLFGSGNILRNNYWGPTDTNLYNGDGTHTPSQYPSHSDDFQSYTSGTTPLEKFLYERNYSKDNLDSIGGTNAHGVIVQHDSLGANPKQLIFRQNVSWNTGGGPVGIKGYDNTYVHNNTWVKAQSGSASTSQQAQGYETPFSGNALANVSDVRNNTMADSPKCLNSGSSRGFYGPYDLVQYVSNWTHGTNHTYDYGATEATYPTLTAASPANLGKADPLFTDRTSGDFRLGASSPLRGAGSSYVTAVGSGSSSTSLTVSDAYPICDGWGIADADWIKIGSGAYVQVSSINYATNVVTLASARTWSSGDSVIVKGTEDVGALPYSYSGTFTVALDNTSIPSGPINFTATVSVPDAVRKIEYIVDGLSVGSSYTSPYTVAWTSDGASHVVEARAYKMWADSAPTQSHAIALNSVPPGTARTSLGSRQSRAVANRR